MALDLAYLRAAVVERGDFSGSARVTAAKVDAQINRSVRRLFNRVYEASEDEFTISAAVSTVSGKDWATLPSDYYMLRKVDWLPAGDTTKPQPVARFQLQERSRYVRGPGWRVGSAIAYRVMGRSLTTGTGKIVFAPMPSQVETVLLHYLPVPPTLTADADVFDTRPGFEEWVIWDAVIPFLVSEESDANTAIAMRDAVWVQDVLPAVTHHDQAAPDRVVDVESSSGDDEEFGA